MKVETTFEVDRVGASLELIYRITECGARIVIGPKRRIWAIDSIELKDGGGQFTSTIKLARMPAPVKEKLMEGVDRNDMQISILINGMRLNTWAHVDPLTDAWRITTMGDMVCDRKYIGPSKIVYAMTGRDYRTDREEAKKAAML
ncbi:MAG TPA: hypothetical protein VGM51_09665 [Armatimonadota bacterium]|jgi:hypothetical protein